jgi:hypothetical protein
MFPSLTSIFGQPRAAALSSNSTPEPEDVSQDPVEQDSVELSEGARRSIPSGVTASTFDAPGVPKPPIAVADDGTYAPSQAIKRLGVAASFSFNMNIQRQVTTVAHAPQQIERQQSGSAARLTALESRSLHYQSVLQESRSSLAGGFSESRSVQTELFYSRTRELAMSLPAGRSGQLEQTSAQVSRTFELNISMDFSFLGQFTTQSNTISSLDDSLFGQYLDNTSGLAGQSDRSGQALQSFFDDVSRILDESEAFVVSSLSSFFDQVASSFGLSNEEAVSLEAMVMDEVASFFNDVESFLSESRSFLAPPAAQALPAEIPAAETVAAETEAIESPEESEPVLAIEPPTIDTEEEDPAAVLA